eukprot:1959818-Prymnesium_polylepis.2
MYRFRRSLPVSPCAVAPSSPNSSSGRCLRARRRRRAARRAWPLSAPSQASRGTRRARGSRRHRSWGACSGARAAHGPPRRPWAAACLQPLHRAAPRAFESASSAFARPVRVPLRSPHRQRPALPSTRRPGRAAHSSLPPAC